MSDTDPTSPETALVPAPLTRKRSLIAPTFVPDSLSASAVTSLEVAMGGRSALIAALVRCPESDDLGYVIGQIADPRNDARALSDICMASGIGVGELLEAYKRGVMAEAQVAAMATVASTLQPVVADVMHRSAPHDISCTACNGTGQATDPSKPDAAPTLCPTCKGTGAIRTLPDLERQKVALDLGGLGPKKAPKVVVDNRKLTVRDASPGGLSRLIQMADQVLHRQRPARVEAPEIDETVVEAELPTSAPEVPSA